MTGNIALICFAFVALVQADKPSPPPAQPQAMPAKPDVPAREALEADFKNMLENAVLEGSWQMTQDGLAGNKPLTQAKTEKYTIQSATKLGGELWLITARIQFADKDVSIPVPVRVIWAEDTAIITLSEFPVPMLGTYSCRVMFHGGFYSGVWYSKEKNYGGVMSGRIVKETSKSQNVETSKQKPNPSD